MESFILLPKHYPNQENFSPSKTLHLSRLGKLFTQQNFSLTRGGCVAHPSMEKQQGIDSIVMQINQFWKLAIARPGRKVWKWNGTTGKPRRHSEFLTRDDIIEEQDGRWFLIQKKKGVVVKKEIIVWPEIPNRVLVEYNHWKGRRVFEAHFLASHVGTPMNLWTQESSR